MNLDKIEKRWQATTRALEDPAAILAAPIKLQRGDVGRLAWLNEADAEFVVHARQDVGDLLEEVNRLNIELTVCGCPGQGTCGKDGGCDCGKNN